MNVHFFPCLLLFAFLSIGPVAHGTGQGDESRAEAKRLPSPTLDERVVPPLWPAIEDDEELLMLSRNYPVFATAKGYHAPVFRRNGKRPVVIGRVRYDRHVRATESVEAPGCERGAWHRISGGALVCTTEGFRVSDGPLDLEEGYATPDHSRIEPFVYAKVKKGSPRLLRIPTADEETLLAGGDPGKIKAGKIVQEWLNGAHFVAIDKKVERDTGAYYRTAMGHYLNEDHLEILEPTGMHGEMLGEDRGLPIAFVFKEDRNLYCLDDGKPERCGTAAKHARLFVDRFVKHDGKKYAVGPRGLALQRDQVRLARAVERPDGIPRGRKWLHLDLAEQTLVAYQEDKPLLATLISSGLDTHATPTGIYRLERRYVTKTMKGPDPDHGVYEVAEVPWTVYYHGNYAIHGAYWHNVFGEQRSHGCTNVPPADARWLFRWLDPKLPRGWHAMLYKEKGWAYFTD
jgi:hypothetical protein